MYINWFDCGFTLIFCAFKMRNLCENQTKFTDTPTHTNECVWTIFREWYLCVSVHFPKQFFVHIFLTFTIHMETYACMCDDDDCFYSKVMGFYSVSSFALSLSFLLYSFKIVFWILWHQTMNFNYRNEISYEFMQKKTIRIKSAEFIHLETMVKMTQNNFSDMSNSFMLWIFTTYTQK